MDFSKLKRIIQPMPEDVLQRLLQEDIIAVYQQRPAYQQNDYLAWFLQAKKQQTRQKRIDQMVQELRNGHQYMGMKYHERREPSVVTSKSM